MHKTLLNSLTALKEEYDQLRPGKEALLRMIMEVELPDAVYNSNAIENSTLTLEETEKILLHQAVPPHHSCREIFEATNLAAITEYLLRKAEKRELLTKELLCLIHGTLISHINDDIAGRFRHAGECVRVGNHIAPPPDHLPFLIEEMLFRFADETEHPLERVTRFHPEFERIHPFCDGNGRVGRAVLNYQMDLFGYPPIIIRNKEKKEYYQSLIAYETDKKIQSFEQILGRLLKESFHKRITYLRHDDILPLAEMAKESSRSPQGIINAAKKQSLPAFRERGRWKVGKKAFQEWDEKRS